LLYYLIGNEFHIYPENQKSFTSPLIFLSQRTTLKYIMHAMIMRYSNKDLFF